MLEPCEEDPEGAEEDALEEELAWKLNLLMTNLVGDMWGRATLYVVPEGSESSWACTLLRTSPEEMRAALEGQVDTALSGAPRTTPAHRRSASSAHAGEVGWRARVAPFQGESWPR